MRSLHSPHPAYGEAVPLEAPLLRSPAPQETLRPSAGALTVGLGALTALLVVLHAGAPSPSGAHLVAPLPAAARLLGAPWAPTPARAEVVRRATAQDPAGEERKNPRTSWMIFSVQRRKQAGDQESLTQEELGEEWRSMTDQQKAPYVALAAEERRRLMPDAPPPKTKPVSKAASAATSKAAAAPKDAPPPPPAAAAPAPPPAPKAKAKSKAKAKGPAGPEEEPATPPAPKAKAKPKGKGSTAVAKEAAAASSPVESAEIVIPKDTATPKAPTTKSSAKAESSTTTSIRTTRPPNGDDDDDDEPKAPKPKPTPKRRAKDDDDDDDDDDDKKDAAFRKAFGPSAEWSSGDWLPKERLYKYDFVQTVPPIITAMMVPLATVASVTGLLLLSLAAVLRTAAAASGNGRPLHPAVQPRRSPDEADSLAPTAVALVL